MEARIVDDSFAIQRGALTPALRLVRTVRVQIRQGEQSGGSVLLQAAVTTSPSRLKSRAEVRVLTDQMAWTVLLSEPFEGCHRRLPKKAMRSEPVAMATRETLAAAADDLVRRAASVLTD